MKWKFVVVVDVNPRHEQNQLVTLKKKQQALEVNDRFVKLIQKSHNFQQESRIATRAAEFLAGVCAYILKPNLKGSRY